MNKSITKTMLMVTIAMVSIMMAAQIARAGVITGTKHDLTSGTGAFKTTSTDQVCVFCHTPHFSSATTSAPLWNRSTPGAAPPYTIYTSETINMTIANPQGVSLACLSCHDGTLAFDALLNKPGAGSGTPDAMTWGSSASNIQASTNAYLSRVLTNDHPISITYDVSADSKFMAITGATVKGANVGGLPLYGSGYNQVECASCHNVHDNAFAPFLRVANAGSGLCLKCHVK